jgi:hypothetical protein
MVGANSTISFPPCLDDSICMQFVTAVDSMHMTSSTHIYMCSSISIALWLDTSWPCVCAATATDWRASWAPRHYARDCWKHLTIKSRSSGRQGVGVGSSPTVRSCASLQGCNASPSLNRSISLAKLHVLYVFSSVHISSLSIIHDDPSTAS